MIQDRSFIAIGQGRGGRPFAKRLLLSAHEESFTWGLFWTVWHSTPGLEGFALLAVVEVENASDGKLWLDGREELRI